MSSSPNIAAILSQAGKQAAPAQQAPVAAPARVAAPAPALTPTGPYPQTPTDISAYRGMMDDGVYRGPQLSMETAPMNDGVYHGPPLTMQTAPMTQLAAKPAPFSRIGSRQ